MKWLTRLSIAGLLFVPALASADATVTTRCVGAHFVRLATQNPSELRFTLIEMDNADVVNPATIQRVTVRDWDGSVVYDAGPEVGVPLPVTTAFTPQLDFNTPVPPGAVYALATIDIWGLNGVNNAPPSARSGTDLSITVEATKKGDPHLFRVHAREITRERVPAGPGFAMGAERSANDPSCSS